MKIADGESALFIANVKIPNTYTRIWPHMAEAVKCIRLKEPRNDFARGATARAALRHGNLCLSGGKLAKINCICENKEAKKY